MLVTVNQINHMAEPDVNFSENIFYGSRVTAVFGECVLEFLHFKRKMSNEKWKSQEQVN